MLYNEVGSGFPASKRTVTLGDLMKTATSNSPFEPSASDPKSVALPYLRGIFGAIVGAVVGGILFHLALGWGIYMLALPGAVLGLTSGSLSRIRSIPLAVFCACLAACLAIYLQWRYFDFPNGEDTIVYLLQNARSLPFQTQLMFVLGVVFAFWFGLGRPKH
jgi:Ca2+/Na+ antiporter